MSCIRAVAVIVGIAATLAGCGGSHDPDRRRPRDHVGDRRRGRRCILTSARSPATRGPATWTAPTPTGPCRECSPGSAAGEAATWIGAEAPGPTRGVRRSSRWASTRATRTAAARRSTTPSTRRPTLHFHPVHLFDVSPGDQVSATLRRRGARWQIEFVDRTRGPPAAAVGGRGGRTAIQRGAVHPGGRHRRAQRAGRFRIRACPPIRFTADRRRRGDAAAGAG